MSTRTPQNNSKEYISCCPDYIYTDYFIFFNKLTSLMMTAVIECSAFNLSWI